MEQLIRKRRIDPAIAEEREAKVLIRPYTEALSEFHRRFAHFRVVQQFDARRGTESQVDYGALLAEVEDCRTAFASASLEFATTRCVRNAALSFQKLVTDLQASEVPRSPQPPIASIVAPPGA